MKLSEVLLDTVAHEAFHAFHYSCLKYAGEEKRWNYPGMKAARDIVKESLAGFFAYIFIESIGGSSYPDRLKTEWKSYDINDYPYSGAHVCLDIKENGFKELLENALRPNWYTSANILATGYHFYMQTVKVCSSRYYLVSAFAGLFPG